MSSTNKTAHYELPQYVENDIFNPLVDDNDAYDKIDTALYNIADAEADDAAEIVGIKSRLDTAEGKVEALETQNGTDVLTTVAQTLSGAVNELKSGEDSLDGRLDVVEDDINNASTGLKVKVSALETQNGSEVLTTTAQTLSGAVNELDSDIETLDSKVDDNVDIFIAGDYNLTKFANTADEETKVYWRFIPKTYKPLVGYRDSVDVDEDYPIKIANEYGATASINASADHDVDGRSEFWGYFRADGVTIHDNASPRPDAEEILCCKDGVLSSMPIGSTTAQLDAENFDWALVGFVTLVENGVPTHNGDPTRVATAFHPRSFIAQTTNGDYIIGCTDGRSPYSQGFTVPDITRFLISTGYGINFAYSLDGGGSVSLGEKGIRVNDFIENENRKNKSIIYFKKENATYNDLLKSCTANIDNQHTSRYDGVNYRQGSLAMYSDLVDEDAGTTGTEYIRVYNKKDKTELVRFGFQKDRVFLNTMNGFKDPDSASARLFAIERGTPDILDIAGITHHLLRASYPSDATSYTNELIPTSGAGTSRIVRISMNSASAVSVGMSADDAGVIVGIRIHATNNYDLYLTPAHIYYRYDGGALTLVV